MGEITNLNKATSKNESLNNNCAEKHNTAIWINRIRQTRMDFEKAEGSERELLIIVKPQKGEVRYGVFFHNKTRTLRSDVIEK